MSSLRLWTNGNKKVGQELGLSQTYEGCEVVVWKGTSWRGGAIAYLGDGFGVKIGLIQGENNIKWNDVILKSELFASNSIHDPNTCAIPFAVVNGWDSEITNVPEVAIGKFSILLTVWMYGRDSTGNLSNSRIQTLIVEQGGGTFTRRYENSEWTDWA